MNDLTKSEKQKMLAGELYLASDPELAAPVEIGNNIWIGGGGFPGSGVEREER